MYVFLADIIHISGTQDATLTGIDQNQSPGLPPGTNLNFRRANEENKELPLLNVDAKIRFTTGRGFAPMRRSTLHREYATCNTHVLIFESRSL